MSPSPEPVAPSPESVAQELSRIAMDEGWNADPGFFLPILTRLYLAAKIEGCQEQARDGCNFCADSFPVPWTGRWWHGRAYCKRPEAHDTLAKLREEAK